MSTPTCARLAAAVLSLAALQGCAVVLGGTAGAIAADEGIVEEDDEFDPFENTEAAEAVEDAVE